MRSREASETVGPNILLEAACDGGGVRVCRVQNELGWGQRGLGVFVCYDSRWISARLRVNAQFRLASCGSREGISEDMALL